MYVGHQWKGQVWNTAYDCCVALHHDATGLSAVCDCGISWSNSLTIFANILLNLLDQVDRHVLGPRIITNTVTVLFSKIWFET